MQNFNTYIDNHQQKFIQELQRFCAQPSIAATGEGIPEMAELVRQTMLDLGADVQVLSPAPTAPPIIYASLGQGDKTLLIYNHYDVQPVDPIELWDSPPFTPTIREGKLYARGAIDDKGHLLQRIQAVRAWQKTIGELPCRINWFIEGEEEIGSPHLEPFCKANPDLLKADGCVWEAGYIDDADRPILILGAKGMLYVELSVQSLSSDLHSANATLAPNAAWRLIWALNTLKAPDDSILIDGLIDHTASPNETDIALLKAIPFEEKAMQKRLGLKEWVSGVSGLEAITRHLFQPTCTICGIDSGYTGQGTKTVLPAKAKAKVDFRLVPNLTAHLVADLLRKHLDKHGFSDIKVDIIATEEPGRSDPNTETVQAAIRSARIVYGVEPVVYPTMAATGPVWPVAIKHGTPMVGFGSTYPNANIHAPNENIRLSDYFAGIRMMGQFLAEF